MRARPESGEKAVMAIRRNRHGLPIDASASFFKLTPSREDLPVDLDEARKVVAELRVGGVWVPGHYDHRSAAHPAQFTQASDPVLPMMHGQDGQSGIHTTITQRQRRTGAPDQTCSPIQALFQHRLRGLHSEDATFAWFIRARACSNIHETAHRPQSASNLRGDSGIRSTLQGVARPDCVVQRAHSSAFFVHAAVPATASIWSARARRPSGPPKYCSTCLDWPSTVKVMMREG